MSKIDYRNPTKLPDDQQDTYFEALFTFEQLCTIHNWSPMRMNTFVVGMCRSSMEDLLGKEEAIKTDREWRRNIDWTVAPDDVIDPSAIDLKPYKKAIAWKKQNDRLGAELTLSAADELIAEVEALRERVTKLNNWLNEHESQLAKSRHETDDARRELKGARTYGTEQDQALYRAHQAMNTLQDRIAELEGAADI